MEQNRTEQVLCKWPEALSGKGLTMQYGNYVRIGDKGNNLEAVAVIAEDMAMTIREIEKDKPGSIVEKAEIIIKEDTIAWKVALLEPGVELMKPTEAK